MKNISFYKFLIALIVLSGILSPGYSKSILTTMNMNQVGVKKKEIKKYKVTFIELGSVRCIPCQKMQVVMKAIEEKYGSQVKVVFYDVWTPEGKPYGEKFGIEQIPTQVFLDENGKEFSRHTGYFPEEELVEILKKKGVKKW